jgi:hypothetical protein
MIKTLDHKKLLNWKIGCSKWQIIVTNNFPKDPRIPKKELDEDEAFCDVNKKTIYMRESCIKQGTQMFLDVLFHELIHAMDSDCAIDHQMYLSDVIDKKEQRIELQELNTELRSAAMLRFMSDNHDSLQHVLTYLANR